MYNKNIVEWGEYEDILLAEKPTVTLYMDSAI